jgi:hypothetical protein
MNNPVLDGSSHEWNSWAGGGGYDLEEVASLARENKNMQ